MRIARHCESAKVLAMRATAAICVMLRNADRSLSDDDLRFYRLFDARAIRAIAKCVLRDACRVHM